jgi:metal-sulfur cluster biosynthetic enzyme
VDQAREALRGVYDPELGIDIVSLGLIYDLREVDGRIVIDMTLTTPGCPVSDGLPQQAETAVAFALGPDHPAPEVRLVWDPPWTPDRLDDQAADILGFPVRR